MGRRLGGLYQGILLYQPYSAAGSTETWPVYLFERVLPRHLEIIYEINAHFLKDEVDAKWPITTTSNANSIIDESNPRRGSYGQLVC